MDSTTTNAQPSPSAPPETETFHHYQVLRREDGALWELGRGAMGVTYKAFDVNLRVPVALKVVNPQTLEDDTARSRFVREARAAARLRHRNVASVHHLGQEGQNFFYAMEFVDGETLEALVRREGPLPTVTALRLALQVARALAAAHREGLVHRDIKPANLMIVPDEDEDGGLLVKVIDFGLARVALGAEHHTVAFSGANSLSALTHAGFVGTPLFASPEQLEEKEVDIRADIYSLGITLWYALAAAPPFTGSLAGIISQHLTKAPPWEKLETLAPPVPAPVRALLARMLEKNRAGRPADPAALRRELEDGLRGLSPEEAEAPAPAAAAEPGRTFSPRPLPGTENPPLAGRYRLERAVGEGSAGRVFLAWDVSQGGRPTAVKMLHADLLVTAEDEAALAETVRRAREAAHPNLVETRSLEQDGRRHFLTQEWLRGFNLVALLRSRGALPVEDALPLLDAAAAAFDHARQGGLPARKLELGLHQVMLHFPPVEGEDDPLESPAIPEGPLAVWPAFALKIDPLGIGRDAAGGGPLLTWAGDQTLVPASPEQIGALSPRRLTRDTHSSIQGLENGATPGDGDHDLAGGLRALAQLAYLLLGGTVQPPSASMRYANLPVLNERANAALRRALLAEPPIFNRAREFAEALRGLRPVIAAVPVPLAPVAAAALPAPPAPEPEIAPRVLETPRIRIEEPPPTAATAYPVLPRSSAVTTGGGNPSRARVQPWREPPEAGDSGAFTRASTASGSSVPSIAHLIEPPPRRGSSPVLGALVTLGLLALLGLGCWRLMNFLLSSPTTEPRLAAPSRRGAASPAATAAARAPRDLAAVPAPSPEPTTRPPHRTALPEPPVPSVAPPPLAFSPAPTPRAETPTPARVPLPAPPAVVGAATPPAPPPTPSRAAPVPAPAPAASTPAERRVRVNISSDPPGAEIVLSGELLGVTGTRPLSMTLPPGEYTVRARYADWPETTQTIRVPPKGVESVDTRIKLTPPRGTAAPAVPLPPEEGGSTVLLPEPERPPAPRRTPEPRDPSEPPSRPAIVVPPDRAGD